MNTFVIEPISNSVAGRRRGPVGADAAMDRELAPSIGHQLADDAAGPLSSDVDAVGEGDADGIVLRDNRNGDADGGCAQQAQRHDAGDAGHLHSWYKASRRARSARSRLTPTRVFSTPRPT